MSNTLKLGNGKWATGKDTVLAYNDLNSNYKPLAFSFSRDTSATVINKDGLIETVGSGEPRIDFKDNTKGALKLEPTRSNLLSYSEDFSNWSGNLFVSNSNVLAPNGVFSAYDITDDNVSNYEFISSNTSTFNGTYTGSVFIKKTIGALSHYAGLHFCSIGSYLIFDTTNGTVNQTSNSYSNIKVDNFGDWWRISATVTANGNDTLMNLFPSISSNGTSISTSAIGTNTFYGAMLEQGSYATSYIPTSGQANGVTRVADSSSQTPPDGVIGQTEGTMFLDFNIDDISSQTQDPVLIYLKNSSGITSYLEMFDNGDFVAVHINSGSITLTKNGLNDGRHKAAFAYKDNDFAFYVDGVLAGSNTNFTVASSQTEIGLQYTSVNYTGKQSVNDVKLYNTRLSNSELAALTTI